MRRFVNRPDVCVVMPVYNEEEVVGDVVKTILKSFSKVVCVDDGSDDDSGKICADAGAAVVRHAVNLGQGAALRTGLEFGLLDPGIKTFVTFDADGQHDLADVEMMLARLSRGDVQIIFGSRFLDNRTAMKRSKRLVLRLAVYYTKMSTGVALTDAHNGLRAFDRSVAAAMRIEMNGMAHASEIVAIVAREQIAYAEVPVHIRYTAYSHGKGQPLLNSVNILFDILFR